MTKQLALPPSATRYDVVSLTGGLDLLTPTLELKSGYVKDALNWEASVTGGYNRIKGYERYDGRPAEPHLAVYDTVTVAFTGVVTTGQTLAGVTSGATGKVISVDGAVLAFTQQTGTFQLGEAVTYNALAFGTVTALGGAGPSEDYDATMLALAANVYRALIQAVPGSGPVRGVAKLLGTVYAWRDNAGATAMAIYKSTAAGWVLVPMLFEVAFTAGNSEYTPGETLTQGGVNATIRGVSLESGAWGGTGVGRLIISAPTGGNFAAGASVGGGTATLSGIQTAITLPPGGRVQTDIGNFGLGPKLYGCDGVGRGFEFDGTSYIPIATGNTPDVPKAVRVHQDHLFFAFGTNFQHSGITKPFTWTALSGSAAYRVTDVITNFLRQSGDQSTGTLVISTLTSTTVLYGTSALDFRLAPFEESAGAKAYSGQRLGGQSLVFAELGVFSVAATQSFGNFTPASLTMKLRPYTEVRKDTCTGSSISRKKSQYRLYFNDGSGLYMTIVNGKIIGSMPVSFPDVVRCIDWQGGAVGSDDTAFFGSDSGYVFRLDTGTSHDGVPIQSYFTLNWANEGNSRILKRYRGASFEVQGSSFARFNVTYQTNYNLPSRVQGATLLSASLKLSTVHWDAFTWDLFTWDGSGLGPTEIELRGRGENIALRIESNSDAYDEFTINSTTIHYSTLKAKKK